MFAAQKFGRLAFGDFSSPPRITGGGFGALLCGRSYFGTDNAWRQQATESELLAFRYDFDANPEVSRFVVYVGTTPGNYTRRVTTGLERNAGVVAVPGLERGKTYFFTITALSDEGVESDFSNEAQHTVPE